LLKPGGRAADSRSVRAAFNKFVGPLILGVCALTWILPGQFSFLSTTPGQAREIAPSLHSGTPWARYLAPEGACRGDEETDRPAAARLQTMRCLLDWARRARGLPALPMNATLSHSAQLKGNEIVRCGDFSHTPCGRAFERTFQAAGYQGRATGENLVWGESLARTPRLLMDSWLHSTGHRESLFRPDWREQGLALVDAASFLGRGPATIYVHQFGG
jgi:uncharacterized protein YkwD